MHVGFGPDAAAVPPGIQQWVKCAVATMYEHREIVSEKGALVVSPFIDGLLDPWRVVSI